MNSNSMKSLILSAVTALLMVGCASMGGGDSGANILATGSHSNIKDQMYQDIHNQADFDAMWSKAFANQSGAPDKPVVDFSKDMVLAIFIGEQPTGGFRIRISKVDTSGADIEVTFDGIQPGQNCPHVQVSKSEPFLIATIPASTKSVNFNPQSERAPACGG
ncbi:MAG: protease complex subunit PrcB family protein [Gammaproteobacteria bacterium]